MTQESVLEIASHAILIALKLAGPLLLVTLGIGLFLSMMQAATQVQEQSLSFVPELGGVALVILVGGNWMLNELISYTRGLYNLIPTLIH